MTKMGTGGVIRQLREERGLSQEEAAKALGVQRVTLSQLENGKRRLTADEAVRCADYFQVSVDRILGREHEPEMKLPPVADKREGVTERISVPQNNMKKFREVLLYLLEKIGARPHIGETVIYKLLYFIDFNYYERYEEQLIGATYIKNTHGPTPTHFSKLIEGMLKKGELIRVDSKYFKYPQRKYLPRCQPDLSVLSARELSVIDDVIGRLGGMNATQISEFSHNDVPWLTAAEGKPIIYEAVFYRTLHYSVRGDDCPVS